MELKIKNVYLTELQSFIKKLLSIDKFIFIKISPTKVVSSVYFPQKDAVKLVSVDVGDIFEFEDDLKEPIKVSFFNGNKIKDALSYFKGGHVSAIIKLDETDDVPIVNEFTVYDDDLSINLFVGDPNLSFMEMSSDNIQKAFDISSEVYRFELGKDVVDRMKSLFTINKENDTFKFILDGDTLRIKEESYDAIISKNVNVSGTPKKQVTVYKKYISILDKENYDAVMCSNKVFLRSRESDTLMTFALCSGLDDD
jgi:hypothetical protein